MTPAAAPRLTHIPDILEEHLEELSFLWGQRQRALRSAAYTMRELGMLEERVEARVQALLAYGDRATPQLDTALTGEDPVAAFAAAYTLLRAGSETGVHQVVAAFANAEGERLDALREALRAVPAGHVVAALGALASSDVSARSAAAAEVLAVQSTFRPDAAWVERVVRDESPAIRAAGWRLVAASGVAVDAKTFAVGMRDPDGAVRSAAIAAAAWTAQPGVLALARYGAATPAAENAELLHLLAVLGDATDLPRIAQIAQATDLGPERLRIAGAFGHPALMEIVLTELGTADPLTAAAAGDAFHKLTGHDVGSLRTAPAARPADPFEAEFVDDVQLPDAALARDVWARVGPQQSLARRLCRGLDVDGPLDEGAVARLDMESRWELFLRARFLGAWHGSPLQLEVYPQAARAAGAAR